MRRFVAGLVVLSSLAGCGSWKRVGSDDRQSPSETLTQIFNLESYYRRIGRVAAGDPLPFIGSVAFAAGRADTAIAVLGLSLENRAFGFQREGNGFVARYRVDISFQGPSGPAVTVGRDELIRVNTFPETQRADESILFQQVFRLTPGRYHLTVVLRDPATGSTTRGEQDLDVPAFAPGSTTAPILAYQVRGRSELGDTLSIVLNPRGTVAYGGDSLLAYIEGYRMPAGARVPFEVRSEQDSVVYSDSLTFVGGKDVEGQVLRLRPDSMALGELKLVVGQGTGERQTSALVSFSSAWVVTNFQDMIALLRYFGEDERLSALKDAPPADRARLCREFWRDTDPIAATPDNEALNAYFTRLGIANTRFKGEGVPGWRTDRGEVFISIGEPDEDYETTPGQVGGRVLRWTYINHRASLYFQDETGFGRYRLTPSSRAEFERVRSRIRRAVD